MNPNITVIALDAIVAINYRSIADFTGIFYDHLSVKKLARKRIVR